MTCGALLFGTWLSGHVFQSRSVRSDHRICLRLLYVFRLHYSRSELSTGFANLSDQLIGQEWRSIGVLGMTFRWSSEYERALDELRIPVNWLSVCEYFIGRLERRSGSLASVSDQFAGQEWRSTG